METTVAKIGENISESEIQEPLVTSTEIINDSKVEDSEVVNETKVVIPFIFDAHYKGDELTKRVCQILNLQSISGWSVVDTYKNLAMVHYNDDADKRVYGYLRGLVVDTVTGDIVAKSFGHTPVAVYDTLQVNQNNMIVVRDEDDVVHAFPIKDTVMKRAVDGVTIRCIWYDNEIIYMTHRKFNPIKSRWVTSRPFLTMYHEANGPTEEDLFDTSKPYSSTCYVFMVCHPELLVGTRQQVNKPYIVHLSSFEMKLSQTDVVPGVPKYKYSTEITGLIKESFILKPEALSLEKANAHLHCGYYQPFDIPDKRQLTGEAVIVSLISNGEVIDTVKVHSSSFDWRSNLRGNNPNIVNQFYSMLNIVYNNIITQDDWINLTNKLILLPLYSPADLKVLYKETGAILVMPPSEEHLSADLYATRDDRIHLLWINYVLSLPPNLQEQALNILDNFVDEREELIEWLIMLEAKHRDLNTIVFPTRGKQKEGVENNNKGIKRVLTLLRDVRRMAMDRISSGNNYARNGAYISLPVIIKNTVRNLINKEHGPSLYGLIREMKNYKNPKVLKVEESEKGKENEKGKESEKGKENVKVN